MREPHKWIVRKPRAFLGSFPSSGCYHKPAANKPGLARGNPFLGILRASRGHGGSALERHEPELQTCSAVHPRALKASLKRALASAVQATAGHSGQELRVVMVLDSLKVTQ